jgi:hypothetical protein
MRTKELIPRFYDAVMWTGLDEPKWSVKAEVTEGVEYEIKYLNTDEIRKVDLFKKRMIEMTPVFLPAMKQGDWDTIIGPILSSKITMPMPEDTTELGMLKSRLREFLGKAKFDGDPTDIRGRAVLLRGLPVVQVHKGEEVVMFRSQDFDKYLKDTRADTVRKNMWFKMADNLGANSERLRVGYNFVSVWYVPADEYRPLKPEAHDFKPEY